MIYLSLEGTQLICQSGDSLNSTQATPFFVLIEEKQRLLEGRYNGVLGMRPKEETPLKNSQRRPEIWVW